MQKPTPMEIALFYVPEDKKYEIEIKKHMKSVCETYNTLLWDYEDIPVGAKREEVIQATLRDAPIVLLLISPDSLSSDNFMRNIFPHALERCASEDGTIVFILTSPSNWKHTPIRAIQVLPTDGKPIEDWPRKDAAYAHIVEKLVKVVQNKRSIT